MKNKIILLIFLIISLIGLNKINAQKLVEQDSESRFYLGGNFGVQFGSVTLIDVSPLLGYRFSEKFSIGAGISYQYYKDARYNPAYTTDIYGVRAFAKYFLFRDIFAFAEYEILNIEIYDNQLNDFVRDNLTGILVGGGYRQWISQRMFMNIMVLWNLNETINYPYNNPIFRVGVGVGL